MLYKNILVPYDKSTHAKHALEAALQLASDDPSAALTALFVTEPPETYDAALDMAARMTGVHSIDVEAARDLADRYRDRELAEIREAIAPIIEGAQNPVTVEVAAGRPHHAILEYSDEHDCDLIVMGCRGLNALHGMLGSVSYAVLRSSEVPVLIIK